MLKVYLETTLFNRFLEDNREYNKETKKLFEKIIQKEIDAYSSTMLWRNSTRHLNLNVA